MQTLKAADLGSGWFAFLHQKNGAESVVVLNAQTDERIVLADRSVKTLREIFKSLDA